MPQLGQSCAQRRYSQPQNSVATGTSYLEIARVLIEYGSQATAGLRELWPRIVFNMLVSNSDDHSRNHGFLLVPGCRARAGAWPQPTT